MDYVEKPLMICCDNSAVGFFSKNNKSESQSKHIDIKFLIVRDHIKKNKIAIEYVNTKLMLTDPMIKGLSHKLYKNHVNNMGLFGSK